MGQRDSNKGVSGCCLMGQSDSNKGVSGCCLMGQSDSNKGVSGCCLTPNCQNRIGGVMVSVLPWSAVHRGFDPWSEQTKDYEVSFVASSLSMHMEV
jgi:hypothetical protein